MTKPASVRLTGPLAAIGRFSLKFLNTVGNVSLFTSSAISHCFRPPFYGRQLLHQMISVGFYSLPVVGMTAIFTGAALALQIYIGSARYAAESAVPGIVVLGITRELGPVLAALMLAGRVGAAMAAEIGTMRVTEQIDALVTLSTHPIKYLVVPRILAGTLMMPVLVLIADILGVYGGYAVSIFALDFNANAYLTNTRDFLLLQDVVSGLVKAAIFGFLVTLMGCYYGYKSDGGAAGVGRATTNAMVSASVLILISNYIVTQSFFAQ